MINLWQSIAVAALLGAKAGIAVAKSTTSWEKLCWRAWPSLDDAMQAKRPRAMERWRSTFAAALVWCGLQVMSSAPSAAPILLPAAGCPMAHCDSRMSDLVAQVSPSVAQTVRIDRNGAGAIGGLGCVSNTRFVACTGGADPARKSNLVAYDADGNRVWEDGGLLGATAWFGAAIIDADDQVIAADQSLLLRVDLRAGKIVWKSAKPDTGTPISPVPVGSDASMILLATKSDNGLGTPELSVWDAGTGALLWHEPIADPVTGAIYQTANTPAVRGNRAYVLAAGVGNSSDGRLYAIEICESDSCGGRGRPRIAWFYPFQGPSGASPLLIGQRIFFDGQRGKTTGLFYGVDDLGMAPSQAWMRKYAGRFGFSAAQDPRGGLWISPWQSGTLLRVHESNGSTMQTISVGSVLALDPSYSAVTAVSVSESPSGAVVLTTGVQTKSPSIGIGPHVAAMDVSTQPGGREVWKYKVSANTATNAATGQYPIVTNASGARRVVFRGTKSSTFFIGEP